MTAPRASLFRRDTLCNEPKAVIHTNVTRKSSKKFGDISLEGMFENNEFISKIISILKVNPNERTPDDVLI